MVGQMHEGLAEVWQGIKAVLQHLGRLQSGDRGSHEARRQWLVLLMLLHLDAGLKAYSLRMKARLSGGAALNQRVDLLTLFRRLALLLLQFWNHS